VLGAAVEDGHEWAGAAQLPAVRLRWLLIDPASSIARRAWSSHVGRDAGPEHTDGRHHELFLRAISEAWAWLVANGLLARRPGGGGIQEVFVTHTDREVAAQPDGLARLQAEQRLSAVSFASLSRPKPATRPASPRRPPMTSRLELGLMGMTMTPAQGSYVEVDGLSIYYELHGEGPPLVLLHGGLLTIELAFGDVLPALAERHKVVAIELQGHGRTADIDRPLSLERLADDVAHVLTEVGVDRADVVGFSLGGLVTVELARRHPERVRRLVLASTHTRPDGFHDEIRSPDAQPGVGRMPTEDDFRAWEEAYRAVAPDPDHFSSIAAKVSAFVGSLQGWSDDELRELTVATLVLIGDNDFVRVEHAAHMQEVLPDARLAVVPGATHVSLLHETDLVMPILRRFLGD